MLWPNIEIEPYNMTIEELASDSAPVEPDAYLAELMKDDRFYELIESVVDT